MSCVSLSAGIGCSSIVAVSMQTLRGEKTTQMSRRAQQVEATSAMCYDIVSMVTTLDWTW